MDVGVLPCWNATCGVAVGNSCNYGAGVAVSQPPQGPGEQNQASSCSLVEVGVAVLPCWNATCGVAVGVDVGNSCNSGAGVAVSQPPQGPGEQNQASSCSLVEVGVAVLPCWNATCGVAVAVGVDVAVATRASNGPAQSPEPPLL